MNSTDTRYMTAYARWLTMRGQLAGNLRFDGHTPSDDESAIALMCRSHCGKLDKKLRACRESEISELLNGYELMYLIGYRRKPDASYVDGQRRRLFNAWQRGDKDIAESSIFGMIALHAGRNDAEQFSAYNAILNRWINDLTQNGCFTGATSYENYHRLSHIMRLNLDSYISGHAEAVKRRWYEYNKVDDLSTLGTGILSSYRHFASSLWPGILSYDDRLSLDNRILSELTTRRDLNPYDRRAYSLALEYNNSAVD